MYALSLVISRSHRQRATSVTHVVFLIKVSIRVWIFGASDIDTSLFSTREPETRVRVRGGGEAEGVVR